MKIFNLPSMLICLLSINAFAGGLCQKPIKDLPTDANGNIIDCMTTEQRHLVLNKSALMLDDQVFAKLGSDYIFIWAGTRDTSFDLDLNPHTYVGMEHVWDAETHTKLLNVSVAEQIRKNGDYVRTNILHQCLKVKEAVILKCD